MIKFWSSPYQLKPQGKIGAVASSSPRTGALLRVQWPQGVAGYADLHPWPELGDQPLDHHLEAIKKFHISPLVEQAVWLAKKDSELRAIKKNAFVGGAQIQNHFLISDISLISPTKLGEIRQAGFGKLKIKLGQDLEGELKFVQQLLDQHPFVLRLDFNGRLTLTQFENFFSQFSASQKSRIEYVEDPMPWDWKTWTDAASIITLAMDLEYFKVPWEQITQRPPFSVLIVKPARMDVDLAVKRINRFGLKFSISNSLDHPLAMAHCYSVAQKLKKFYPNTLLDCSCFSLGAYEPNDFFDAIKMTGPLFKEIKGTGMGFDELLGKLPWNPL
jgi:O-succinylbenzoate synthase